MPKHIELNFKDDAYIKKKKQAKKVDFFADDMDNSNSNSKAENINVKKFNSGKSGKSAKSGKSTDNEKSGNNNDNSANVNANSNNNDLGFSFLNGIFFINLN
jgi:hypothetical protein